MLEDFENPKISNESTARREIDVILNRGSGKKVLSYRYNTIYNIVARVHVCVRNSRRYKFIFFVGEL